MFDFAWKLNKDDKDLLWLAIIALTEQLLLGKIENTQYTLEMGKSKFNIKKVFLLNQFRFRKFKGTL